MKKMLLIMSVVILSILFSANVEIKAATANGSLTGSGTVRAGDTITLSFNINGNNIYGASGTLSYDSNQVTLIGTSQIIGSPWAVEFNGNNFVAYDNNLSNPINGNKALFSVTFKVKSVAAGTNIKIAYTNVKASDGSTDANVGTITYSVTVAPPLSTENKLGSLAVSNATIEPAFNENVLNYTANVPFSVSKLDIIASAKDGKAKVSVNSPNLVAAGTTNVNITVTAENGVPKTYVIKVTREQDPNYVASNNNSLAGISVDGFLLSPVFNADVTKYVIWLPYEVTSVKVSGIAADKNALVEIVGGENLYAGQDNEIKITCTAENGTKKEYVVIAKRAMSHDGTIEDKPTEETQPSTEPTSSEVESDNVNEESSEQEVTQNIESSSDYEEIQSDGESDNDGISIGIVVIVEIIALVIGFISGYFIKGFINNDRENKSATK